jgi:hypothetical protein
VTDDRSDRTRLNAREGNIDLSYLCATDRGRKGAQHSTDWAFERSTAKYGTLRFAHFIANACRCQELKQISPPIHSE